MFMSAQTANTSFFNVLPNPILVKFQQLSTKENVSNICKKRKKNYVGGGRVGAQFSCSHCLNVLSNEKSSHTVIQN